MTKQIGFKTNRLTHSIFIFRMIKIEIDLRDTEKSLGLKFVALSRV